MSITTGNAITGAGGYGSGVIHSGGNSMWFAQTVGLVGAGALSLTVAGRLARPALALASPVATRLFVAATSPINWGLYNAYREAGDFAHWARGGEMALGVSITGRPWTSPGGTLIVPFPWLDIQPSQSSGGGGPGGLPNLHQPPLSIEETGEILSDPPSRHDYDGTLWVDASGTTIDYQKRRCPKGKRWSRRLRRCVDRKKFPPGFTTIPYIDRKG